MDENPIPDPQPDVPEVSQPAATTAAPSAPGPPAPPLAKSKSGAGTFFLGALVGCMVLAIGAVIIAVIAMSMKRTPGALSLSTNKVAVIPIEGEIFESRKTIEAIHRYAENSTVKAIVMRVNSPGGAIAPTQEIYEEIRRVRAKSGKPIVASFDSVAASGGYYIGAACDRIVANPGSITGSIGVILQWMSIEDLVKWAKMHPETLTSGAMKAAGSPLKQLTDAERAYLQRIVLQLHAQFVKAVANGRTGKISHAEVAKLADGRVFTGEEALALRLVDELGNLDDAVRAAGKLAGIKGDPAKIYPRKRDVNLFDLLSDADDADSLMRQVVGRRGVHFLYRWGE